MNKQWKVSPITFLRTSAWVAAVCLSLLPQSLQAQPQTATAGIDPTLLAKANTGNAEAQFNLGTIYDLGLGVKQDPVKAATWYRKAAEQGYAHAQSTLAALYFGGEGVPQDYAQAAEWYRKAAEQGLAEAQYNLGQIYAFGRSVPQDYELAIKWYRKAADQGNVDAQYNLGTLFMHGQGVPQDYSQAAVWFLLYWQYLYLTSILPKSASKNLYSQRHKLVLNYVKDHHRPLAPLLYAPGH